MPKQAVEASVKGSSVSAVPRQPDSRSLIMPTTEASSRFSSVMLVPSFVCFFCDNARKFKEQDAKSDL